MWSLAKEIANLLPETNQEVTITGGTIKYVLVNGDWSSELRNIINTSESYKVLKERSGELDSRRRVKEIVVGVMGGWERNSGDEQWSV